MTGFYKIIENGYIVGIGTNGNETVTEITEAEYNEIRQILRERPETPDGYCYRLTEGLEWVLVELPPEPDEITEEEAYRILAGEEE